MKKDRNAFFQNQSASSYFYPTNTMPQMPPQMQPQMPPQMGYPMATESSSNFYQGPIMAPSSPMDNYSSELESRLAKIERQIARLDTRITKLESEAATNIGGTDYTTTNNMYVI